MKNILNNEWIQLVARLILGFFLIAAGVSKIPEPELFAIEIGNYKIMPELIVNLSAMILPWFELLCGMMLIFGLRLKAGSLAAGAMMFVFIIAVGSAMARGLDINCGCYSKMKAQPVGWTKIIENTGLFLLSVLIFFSKNLKLTLENFIIKNK